MFYEGVDASNRRSIGLAVSTDGWKWQRLSAPILEAGLPGAWDAGGVGAPCAVPMAGSTNHPDKLHTNTFVFSFPGHANFLAERVCMLSTVHHSSTIRPHG
jgi:hypothetical protein